ncbi:hypothetical protein [Spirosoma luteum]|uniref:hypothetical protein n=1 Tax=Spirosoma luteum TaxID=431553 RepID=UPI000379ADDC|nr:hypothetical protein [Spirosoma luteum]
METYKGADNLPPFKINGTNADLQRFEHECKRLGLDVSKANDYFRDDYEHCLIPAYAYNPAKAGNIKLQLLSSDVYYPKITYDLKTDFSIALSMVEVINSHNQSSHA